MTDEAGSRDLEALARRFEEAEDALRAVHAATDGAQAARNELRQGRETLELFGERAQAEMAASRTEIAERLNAATDEFRNALHETVDALTVRIAQSEVAAAAVGNAAQHGLERSQTAVTDLASQARQQSRALTDIARDLKDTVATLNEIRPEAIMSRLDALMSGVATLSIRVDASDGAAREVGARLDKFAFEAAASRELLARRFAAMRRLILASLILIFTATSLGLLATTPYWSTMVAVFG